MADINRIKVVLVEKIINILKASGTTREGCCDYFKVVHKRSANFA